MAVPPLTSEASTPRKDAGSPAPSNMRRTVELGAEFWNDSCALPELADAVAHGATGATSNPVITLAAVKGDPATWTPVLDALIAEHPQATEDEIAWLLVDALGRRAAALLQPVFDQTRGVRGFLSMQVDPRLFRDAARMVEHGRALAALAPNIAIKVPCTEAGIAAAEELVAGGVNVNATVSFTVSQAVAVAEAFERGLKRALAAGAEPARLHPYATLMVGRLDDLLQRDMARDSVPVDPGLLHWAGIAVFKKAHAIFRERGFRATLLAAAYRHHMHWSQLIGPGVVLTMPYAWWRQFEASDIEVKETLPEPVPQATVDTLYRRFADFRLAYDEGAIAPADFQRFGATLHTLDQFLGGFRDLAALVRGRMLRAG